MPEAYERVEDLIRENRSAILKKWFGLVIDSYPKDTARFLKKEKDSFANPVGSTIEHELGSLLDQLLQEPDREKASRFLDRIIRIRAIQDFTPSDAVAFVFQLKDVIREALKPAPGQEPSHEAWRGMDRRIDRLGFLAFDTYTKCREQIADIRVKEIKQQTERLLRLSGMSDGPAKPDENLQGGVESLT